MNSWQAAEANDDVAYLSAHGAVQVFGLSLTWHAYLSVMISQRARSLLPMLNPVSSGIVQL
jgi:hypothetical protein